jgi:class 3 adenylate cyclase/tetratricopeptide (TPR) repeat protein
MAAAVPASPRAYTPRYLADRILSARGVLEGERKQITVLFCDIVDSSLLAERLEPEVMHQLMGDALRLMAEAVHRYEGFVNQFLGDGLMALFGAPVALEDHALRGVQAALTIHETLGGYNEQLRRNHGVELRVRTGVNTGLVVVGKIGDDLQVDYSAVGSTTILAARVQQAAEPGTILISGTTHPFVDGYVRTERAGPISVKGWEEPVMAFRVTGRRRARSRFEVLAERRLTPLVARRQELAFLQDCLARVQQGRGQVVGISGEPGAGKSRLIYEFRRSIAEQSVTWLEGFCLSYGEVTPYFPILEILRRNFVIDEDDNPLQIQEKLTSGVVGLDPALVGIVPFLGDLFGLPVADDTIRYLDPPARRRRTFEAILTLTATGARRRPHVIVVEDVQWADRTTLEFLSFLIESMAGLPVLVLLTYRAGHAPPGIDKTYCTQIGLDLLSEQEGRELVVRLLESRDLPPDLLEFVQAKAEGNPLFLEEITSALLERGILIRRNGGYRWAGKRFLEAPASVRDIILARIDNLEESVKRTVQQASVIGREFGLRLLTRVATKAEEVPDSLNTLRHLELIRERQFFPELEYIFKHAIVQDVAYDSLLLERRRQLHGAIAAAIEELYADRLAEQAAILTYHYSRSNAQRKAIEYALLAGDHAARLYANSEATSHYERALEAARALPDSVDKCSLEIDGMLKLAAVGVTRQDIERDQANLESARRLAEDLRDEARLARVLYWLGRTRYVLYDPRAAVVYARQSLEIAERRNDDSLAAPPVNLLGRALWQQSEFVQASEMLVRSAELMQKLGNKAEEATAAGFAGNVLGLTGRFDQAFEHLDRGVRLGQEIRNPFAEAAGYFYRGIIQDQRGEWTRALQDFRGARDAAERVGDLFRLYLVTMWEGRAYTMVGDPLRGRILLEESLAAAGKIGTRFGLAWLKSFLAASLAALGLAPAARAECEEAIGLAQAGGDRWIEAIARQTLGEIAMKQGPSHIDAAQHELEESLRLHRETSALPQFARSSVSYARVLQAKGMRTEAEQALAEARSRFLALGMGWDLDHAKLPE